MRMYYAYARSSIYGTQMVRTAHCAMLVGVLADTNPGRSLKRTIDQFAPQFAGEQLR